MKQLVDMVMVALLKMCYMNKEQINDILLITFHVLTALEYHPWLGIVSFHKGWGQD